MPAACRYANLHANMRTGRIRTATDPYPADTTPGKEISATEHATRHGKCQATLKAGLCADRRTILTIPCPQAKAHMQMQLCIACALRRIPHAAIQYLHGKAVNIRKHRVCRRRVQRDLIKGKPFADNRTVFSPHAIRPFHMEHGKSSAFPCCIVCLARGKRFLRICRQKKLCYNNNRILILEKMQ